jgi:aminoglycoside/choline kinase family phosphotransferase
MTALTLPDQAGDVDAAWLTAALRAGGLATDASIINVEPEKVAEAVALIGEITRFTLSWDREDPALPASLIAKFPSALPDNRALALAMGYYECEHRFYDEVADGCGLRTPGCWFSGADAAAGRYALLLEDLGAYERVDQLDGASPTHAAAVVDSLADLHAAWWASAGLDRLPWLPDGLGDEVRVYGDLCSGSWPAFAEATADIISDEDRAVAERFLEGYGTMIDRSLDAPHTLVHRDFRVDNMLFDGDQPVVFDWGSVAHGGALYDLAYFVSGSMSIEDRRAHGEDLLERYRRRLAVGGVEIDDADFLDWHAVGALFCLVVPILAGGNVLDTRDEKGERLVAEGIRRLFTYLHDHDAIRFLD